LEGFSLHANTHLHANDRQGLERLCRYGARGALALERLSRAEDGRIAYRRTPRVDWAELLSRTFDLDVFVCVRCGGRRRVLAYVQGGGGVRAILEHLGLPTACARLAPARGPPQAAGC
ncbi:MAG TPA: transposase, partial [Myxococcaceae bacterium]